jgi:acyl-CoA reductase-like NAD-dependent aldehyde dehydrogenase
MNPSANATTNAVINTPAPAPATAPTHVDYDAALALLAQHKPAWAATTVAQRIAILGEIKECLMPVAQAWAEEASRQKGLDPAHSLAGEEWISGPYAVMSYCNAMVQTLSQVDNAKYLDSVPVRQLANGQIAARVLPHTIWDYLLLSGVSAEVWMQPGVTRANLAQHTGGAYAPGHAPLPKVNLVLGAGNIASIAPLDCLHKLFTENELPLLKMNPINAYLKEFLDTALKPLIDRGFLRIMRGDVAAGQYLCNHPLVETIHITGSGAAHDSIVWGSGSQAIDNKKAGTPQNTRPITSELGGVGPTIVVPGPWTAADIKFQAEHIATQKLHNAGFNCIACQVLILPTSWSLKSALVNAVQDTIAESNPRPLYYPGAGARLAQFQTFTVASAGAAPTAANQCVIAPFDANAHTPATSSAKNFEVFAPALSTTDLPGGDNDPEAFLVNAIAYANEQLAGTLGANILIHPKTMQAIGRARFESIISQLHYGCIAINAWTGLGFLVAPATWGAYPGHTLADVQSGIGVVHNTMLFDKPERTVVEAPFQPFPRNLLSGSFALLPRPPWYITNRRAQVLGKLLTRFQYRPGFLKIPLIFINALRG